MAAVGIGLLGCGVVGTAVARRLLAESHADAFRLVAIAVRDLAKSRGHSVPRSMLVDDALAVVEDPAVDVVIEVMGGIDPARGLIERALCLGKPVVTANKALLGAAGPELRNCAATAGVPLLYEAAVCGAIPLLRGLAGLLAGDRIVKLEGVLNGTANYVLSAMETDGTDLHEAAAQARMLGFAEADPTRDLDGSDTADKLALLSQYVFFDDLRSAGVARRGIQDLTRADIRDAVQQGRRWRLLGCAVEGQAQVEPVPLRDDHPLARITGADNGLLVTAERAGSLLFAGPGAGAEPTASAILADVADAVAFPRRRAPDLPILVGNSPGS